MSQKKKKQERLLEKSKQIEAVEQRGAADKLRWGFILKENALFLIVLILGITGLYLNSLQGHFVSDDYATITQNPEVANIWRMYKVSGLVGMLNSLIALAFGVTSPVPFHVVSLGLYLAACVTAFVFVYVVLNKRTAIITSIIFAAMPIHVEAVSWISGKPYLLNAIFVLLAMTFLVQYRKSLNQNYKWLFLASLPMAFLAERVRSLGLVFLVPLYFAAFDGETLKKAAMSKYGLLGGGLAMAAGVILWPAILGRVTAVNSGYNATEGVFYNPFFQYPTAIPKYLQMALFPTDLTLYHTMYILPGWLNWLILITFLTLVVWAYFGSKKYFFALAFIFAAAAPSMAPVKVSWLVAERYLFLGSLGVAMTAGLIINDIWQKRKYAAVGLLAVITAAYGVRVYLRNIDWQTNHNLWVNTVQVSPNSHNAWNNIGDDYDKLNQPENAIKGFTQSTIVKENYADAYHNRANILYKMGRLDLARDSYNLALKYSPGLFQTYLSLVQVDLMEKKLDLAYQHASKAIELEANNPQSYFAMGVVLANAGQIDQAESAVKKSLELAPGYKMAQDVLIQLQALKQGQTIPAGSTQ